MEIKSAEEILYSKVDFEDIEDSNTILEAMKEYAEQFIDLAAELGDSWENSGELSQEILKVKQLIK